MGLIGTWAVSFYDRVDLVLILLCGFIKLKITEYRILFTKFRINLSTFFCK